MLDDMTFQGESIDSIRGSRLLVYTDGLNEAENPRFELFGNDRIMECVNQLSGQSSTDIIHALQEAVEKHRAGADPSDDLTLLCIKLI
jgi:serine phosphatase RsbU (regulator of sigma subunit)